jgi:hypothetical protein
LIPYYLQNTLGTPIFDPWLQGGSNGTLPFGTIWVTGKMAFGKFSKNIILFGPNFDKYCEKHSKYRRITKFQFEIGPQKFPSGPRLGHPWFRGRWIFQIYTYIYIYDCLKFGNALMALMVMPIF